MSENKLLNIAHIQESQQSLVEKPQTAPIVEEVYEIAPEKTLDNLINHLINDTMTIAILTQKYNEYLNIHPFDGLDEF